MKFATAAALIATAAAVDVPETFVAPNMGMRLRDIVGVADLKTDVKRMTKGKKDKKGKKGKSKAKKNGYATLTFEDEESGMFQRQIYPVGQCYEIQSGSDPIGSEMLKEVTITKDGFTANLRYWRDSATCDGDYEESVQSGGTEPYKPDHEKSLKKALKLPKWAEYGSTVYTYYYSSNECTTTPGSYFQMANGCVSYNNETETTDDDYTLNYACNTTGNSLDYLYYLGDSCDGSAVGSGSESGDSCADRSDGSGDQEWVTFECTDGGDSDKSVKSPKAPKSPKSPKEPKSPKTPKSPKSASIVDRLTNFVSSVIGSKKLR